MNNLFNKLKEKRRNEKIEELSLVISELSNEEFLDLIDIILIEYDWRTSRNVRRCSNTINTID